MELTLETISVALLVYFSKSLQRFIRLVLIHINLTLKS